MSEVPDFTLSRKDSSEVYADTDAKQLRTRIGAFIEMLNA